MNQKALIYLSVLVGIVLIILSIIYFTTPANHLPSFIPGASQTLTKTHYTHAIGTLILGIGAFVFAWFQSGKKSSK